jgi:hypothetical protein
MGYYGLNIGDTVVYIPYGIKGVITKYCYDNRVEIQTKDKTFSVVAEWCKLIKKHKHEIRKNEKEHKCKKSKDKKIKRSGQKVSDLGNKLQ